MDGKLQIMKAQTMQPERQSLIICVKMSFSSKLQH